MLCVFGCSWRNDVCRMCECYRGDSSDGCVLASTLYKYTLRKANLFVLSRARVRRMRRRSISSELLMCGGGVCSILFMYRDTRCLEIIDVCIWRMFVFMSVVENVCYVAAVIKDSVYLALECWSMLYVCVRGVMDVVFSVCIVMRGAVGARVWKVWVLRHADVVCLCLVWILWQFSMVHSAWLAFFKMLVDDARGDHVEEAYSRAGLMTAL